MDMLKNTFLHVPGVGPKTEKTIWERQVFSWSDFVKNERKISGLSRNSMDRISEYLFDSMKALKKNDAKFFAEKLPKREWWRLYPEFRDSVAFLDIETTGLSRYYDDITLIGLFDGEKMKTYVRKQNFEDFEDDIQKYSVLITFGGTLFDVPFLESEFESVRLPPVHIDLRYFLRRLGYKGGLKAIEEKFGITRGEEIQNVDGYWATVLWNRYVRGNADALERLVKYNVADITNLKTLIELGCRIMKERLLFSHVNSGYRIDMTRKPEFDVKVEKRNDSNFSLIVSGDSPIPINLKANQIGRVHINMLLSKFREPEKYPRVVGIDLSASEERKTGWAFLEGKRVKTKIVKSDEEIINTTIRANPDLISIDSPLSLPKGRDCTSDECECRKFGITRECERILLGRRIYIFPCLIRSMQPLTERGIRLKKKFEKLGFSVIESYPGAAQDILRIIRKKVSIEELKQGLVDFGLTGDFVNKKSTHDELDAVTSALVGYFYSTEDYEALGNEQEGYLIVPKPLNR